MNRNNPNSYHFPKLKNWHSLRFFCWQIGVNIALAIAVSASFINISSSTAGISGPLPSVIRILAYVLPCTYTYVSTNSQQAKIVVTILVFLWVLNLAVGLVNARSFRQDRAMYQFLYANARAQPGSHPGYRFPAVAWKLWGMFALVSVATYLGFNPQPLLTDSGSLSLFSLVFQAVSAAALPFSFLQLAAMTAARRQNQIA